MYSINVYLISNPQAQTYKYKDILNYLSECKKNQKLSYNQLLASIKKYYDYLIEAGIRNEHPCKNLTIKRNRNKDIIHQDLFSSAELELLMVREERYVALKIRNQAIASLLIYQGLTTAEIVNLRQQHVDLDNGNIFIKGSNTLSQRHLELLPKQCRIFDRYINDIRPSLLREHCNPNELLLGKLGTPFTGDDIHYLVSTFKGLFPDRKLTTITIRQSVIANWLNERKLPLEQVQLLSGHKWMSSTERYRSSDMNEQRELINRFDPMG